MDGSYTLPNMFLGNDIHIGARAIIWTVNNKIIIADKVIMGPEVIVNGSDHDMLLAGKFMIDIKEENAKDIVFETDVWVGARATILKGVRIGRGAVIGAGTVVTKSIPPYWIVGGNPARPLRLRGTVEEILAHERSLYPPEERLSPETVEETDAQFRTVRDRWRPEISQ
jgi:maltose O-acetyltransferase